MWLFISLLFCYASDIESNRQSIYITFVPLSRFSSFFLYPKISPFLSILSLSIYIYFPFYLSLSVYVSFSIYFYVYIHINFNLSRLSLSPSLILYLSIAHRYDYYNIYHKERHSKTLAAWRTVFNHSKRVLENKNSSYAQAIHDKVESKKKREFSNISIQIG